MANTTSIVPSTSREIAVFEKGLSSNLTEVINRPTVVMQKNFNQVNIFMTQLNTVMDKTAKSTDKTKTKFQKLAESLAKVSSVIGTGIASSLSAIGAASWAAAEQATASMNTIKIGTGATGEELKGLMASYETVGASVPDNLGSVASVIADVHKKTGATGEVLEDMSKKIMDLGSMTGVSSSTISTSLTGAMKNWQVGAEQGGQTFDKLFFLSQKSGIGVNTLADKLTKYGEPLRGLGYDFDTSAALIAQWTNQGLDADMVLGSFSKALGNMSKVGVKDTNKALTIAINKIKQAGTTAEATKLGMEAFGDAGPTMAAAIREGSIGLDSMLQDMTDNSAGIIEKTSAATETVGDKYKSLQNKISIGLAPLGQQLMSIVEKAYPGIEQIVTLLSTGLANAMPYIESFAGVLGNTLQTVLLSVADAVGFFFQNIDVLGPAVVAFAAVIGVALVPSLLTAAVAGWTAIAPLLPFIGIGLALAAVVAGIILVIKNWGSIVDWFAQKWAKFTNWLSGKSTNTPAAIDPPDSSDDKKTPLSEAFNAVHSPVQALASADSPASKLMPSSLANSTDSIVSDNSISNLAVTKLPASPSAPALPPAQASLAAAYPNARGTSTTEMNPVINITMNGSGNADSAQDIAEQVKKSMQDVFESASRRQGIVGV
jgi:phage-related minor tail protein